MAQMDGDATFKPVLHLVFAPIASEWLAPSVRQQLGMKVIPESGLMLEEFVSKNTQKRQEDQPTVGHVHSTRCRNVSLFFVPNGGTDKPLNTLVSLLKMWPN